MAEVINPRDSGISLDLAQLAAWSDPDRMAAVIERGEIERDLRRARLRGVWIRGIGGSEDTKKRERREGGYGV